MESIQVDLTVNGREHRVVVEPRRSLGDMLRHDLELTGTHLACEEGVCGACTVLLDGLPARSCLVLAAQAAGRTIETVEALSGPDGVNPLQQSLLQHHGLQCGFCTPGLLMSLTYAERTGMDGDAVTSELLPGHLCRCTGYTAIKNAIEQHWNGGHIDAEVPG